MSAKYLGKPALHDKSASGQKTRRYRWSRGIVVSLWVLIGFGAAQVVLIGVLRGMQYLGVSFINLDTTVFNALVAAVVYTLSLVVVIGVPWVVGNYRTTKQDMGMTRLPSWMDILLAPAGFIVYFLCTALLIYTVSAVIPGFDADQSQQIGFSNLMQYYEYLLAFITLVVVAPVAEEILFRGYLYGKIHKVVPVWGATIITSLVFACLHLPGDSQLQWNVALDVFALSVILCALREVTGSIWTGMLLHILKNGLAFYLLFINPVLFHTIGG
jgi:membrane protease YdiL (CAAX protease family)